MTFPTHDFSEAIIFLDDDNYIIGMNAEGERLLMLKQADLLGKLVDEVFPRQSSSSYRDEILNDGRKEVSLSRSDGKTIYVELTISTIYGLKGKHLGRAVIIRDRVQVQQSEMRLKQEQALRTQNLMLRALQETTFDLHSSLDLDVVLRNIVERACKLLDTTNGYLYSWEEEQDELRMVVGIGALSEVVGYSISKGEGVAGTVWQTEKPIIVPDYDTWPGRSSGFNYGMIRSVIGMPLILKEKVVGVLGIAHGAENDVVFTNDDLSVLNQFADMAVVALQNARLFEKAQKEIDFRRKTEIELRDANQLLQLQIERVELLQEQLQEIAVRDPLTGLYNRRYLHDALEIEFAHPRRSKLPMGIWMMDSDQLKEINDEFGHKAGDDFLVHIANIIRESIRAGDIACRYGGDEFVVVLSNVTKDISLERAEKIRKKIASHRIIHRNKKISISVSIGISMYPAHGSTGDVLLQRADQALYEAKRRGKNCVVLFSRGLNQKT
jgi:diguanylate cyclase (GGDEF)-like protein/PAS domain S-box-containing protein